VFAIIFPRQGNSSWSVRLNQSSTALSLGFDSRPVMVEMERFAGFVNRQYKVERRREIDPVFPLRDFRHEIKRRLVVKTRRPVVQPIKRGIRRSFGSIHRIALDGAVRKTQRECGVRINRFAVKSRTGLSQFFRSPRSSRIRRLLRIASESRERMDRLYAPIQRGTCRRQDTSVSSDDFRGNLRRCSAVEHCFDPWIVWTELIERILQGKGQQRLLDAG